jgi:GT2 family glycosyltransferase
MGSPEIAVVVASHDRPLRLLWLLNALEDQTLERSRFEIVVAHDSRGPGTAEVLGTHPLHAAGTLRALAFPPGSTGPGARRNAGWSESRAPLIAFTDDDCRPLSSWLERLLAACRAHPGGIVQGATAPDPDEALVLRGTPWARSVQVRPPTPWGETCNVAYPRAVLERLGGFDETAPEAAGEDTDLLQRALAAGVALHPAPEALTYHAVEALWLPGRLAAAWRWQHLALAVKRHPGLRRELPGRIWWRREHAALALAALAVPLARNRRAYAALALPWVRHALGHRSFEPRGLLRSLSELPGRAAIDAVEVAAMVRGSLRYRTLLL